MKYSTSPYPSRCNSPPPQTSSFNILNSTLPAPITHKHNCIGAASKCYKYLRKLLKFDQMDFEFAIWQVIFLLISPQKVYRNFQNRKQTKLQFARDDPAFLVLLGCWLCLSSIVFAVVTGLNFVQFLKFLLYSTFVDCIGVGLLIATVFWFVMNYHLRYDRSQDLEWGYAFDIHLNAFFPPLILLHMVQLFLYPSFINNDTFSALFLGNSFWLISAGYYIYITFLGYASVDILHHTVTILWALPLIVIFYIISLFAGCNISRRVIDFYIDRAIN